jgi:AcrR family transcriptional regulator
VKARRRSGGSPRRAAPGPKPGLTRAAVVAAALAVADAEGLEGVSMRRIAATLGVAPMGLYRYFPNKQALLAALYDAALGGYDPAEHARGDWRARLASAFGWFRRALVSHPAVLPLAARHAGIGRTSDRISEHVLALLREVAVDDAEAARAFFALVGYVVGFALLEHAALRQREAAGVRDAGEWLRLSRLRFEALPKHEYPSLVATAPHIGGYWTDAQFEDGLARLLGSVQLRAR